MSVILGWLSSIWAKLALVGAVLLALLGVYAAIRKNGADSEKVKEAAKVAAARSKADAVQSRIDATGDAELGKLRDKWTKPS